MAAQNDPVSCSVSVDYVPNGVLREHYQKDFVVDTATPFSDDFSTVTRFKFFDATTQKVSGVSTANIAYFNDVGVFNSIDFRAKLNLRDDRGETTDGSYTFFTLLPASAEHTTNYSLTCKRVKG
jgi:hypothetical protein